MKRLQATKITLGMTCLLLIGILHHLKAPMLLTVSLPAILWILACIYGHLKLSDGAYIINIDSLPCGIYHLRHVQVTRIGQIVRIARCDICKSEALERVLRSFFPPTIRQIIVPNDGRIMNPGEYIRIVKGGDVESYRPEILQRVPSY